MKCLRRVINGATNTIPRTGHLHGYATRALLLGTVEQVTCESYK
jgi:hypothetical protein